MLQLKPQTIRIVNIYDDGSNAKHFTFEPKGFVHDKPIGIGQFFMLTVPGSGIAPFTYTSMPYKNGRFNALIRKVGRLTESLFSLKVGDVLGYNGPFGNGWPIEQFEDKNVIIVAGGCGLAPVATTIDYLINKGRCESVTLLYGARDLASQVLTKERARWQAKIKLCETLEEGADNDHSGLPTQHLSQAIKEYEGLPSIVLTCGPEVMMMAVAKTCMDSGLQSSDIWMSVERRMRCGVGLCGHCYVANSYACKQGPAYRYDDYLSLKNKMVSTQQHQGAFQYC